MEPVVLRQERGVLDRDALRDAVAFQMQLPHAIGALRDTGLDARAVPRFCASERKMERLVQHSAGLRIAERDMHAVMRGRAEAEGMRRVEEGADQVGRGEPGISMRADLEIPGAAGDRQRALAQAGKRDAKPARVGSVIGDMDVEPVGAFVGRAHPQRGKGAAQRVPGRFRRAVACSDTPAGAGHQVLESPHQRAPAT